VGERERKALETVLVWFCRKPAMSLPRRSVRERMPPVPMEEPREETEPALSARMWKEPEGVIPQGLFWDLRDGFGSLSWVLGCGG